MSSSWKEGARSSLATNSEVAAEGGEWHVDTGFSESIGSDRASLVVLADEAPFKYSGGIGLPERPMARS
jgi:hypothetical protein